VHSSVQETTLCAIRTIDQANKKKTFAEIKKLKQTHSCVNDQHDHHVSNGTTFFDDQFTISDGEPHHILP
jgi:hypothetical protein